MMDEFSKPDALPEPTWGYKIADEMADAERLATALEGINIYGYDTLSYPSEETNRAKWYREGVREMTSRARAALADYRGK